MNKPLEALIFARKKHEGQLDDNGNDYFYSHIEQVVRILNKVTNDEDTICAAYLHDTLEDTDTTYEELVDMFGKTVADLVNEVTHDGQADNKGFYFPRLKSHKAIMIKFADRLSNLSRMENWTKDRQLHYLKRSKFWKSE